MHHFLLLLLGCLFPLKCMRGFFWLVGWMFLFSVLLLFISCDRFDRFEGMVFLHLFVGIPSISFNVNQSHFAFRDVSRDETWSNNGGGVMGNGFSVTCSSLSFRYSLPFTLYIFSNEIYHLNIILHASVICVRFYGIFPTMHGLLCRIKRGERTKTEILFLGMLIKFGWKPS